MEPKFMISEVFGTSWKYTKSQIWVLVGLFIGYFILSSIISLFGMPAQGSMVGKIILLIVPGIYLAIRLQFYSAYIVEEDCGIIESLQKSWDLTKGQGMPLFLLLLAMIGTAIVGCILFFVGLFVAVPLIYMMQCYTFRELNTISTEEEVQQL